MKLTIILDRSLFSHKTPNREVTLIMSRTKKRARTTWSLVCFIPNPDSRSLSLHIPLASLKCYQAQTDSTHTRCTIPAVSHSIWNVADCRALDHLFVALLLELGGASRTSRSDLRRFVSMHRISSGRGFDCIADYLFFYPKFVMHGDLLSSTEPLNECWKSMNFLQLDGLF